MPKKILKNHSHFGFKSILLLALTTLSSCVGNTPDNRPTEIRIVDLNGNPKPIKRFVPEGNAQIIASQNAGQALAAQNNAAPFDTNSISQNNTTQLVTNNNLTDLSPTSPPKPIEVATAPVVENVENASRPEVAVSYDLSNDDKVMSNTKIADSQKASSTTTSRKKFKLAIGTTKAVNVKTATAKSGIFVQIGSFGVMDNANKALTKLNKISDGTVEEMTLGDKKSYRVLLGPVASKKVSSVLKQAKNAGFKDAFIVR